MEAEVRGFAAATGGLIAACALAIMPVSALAETQTENVVAEQRTYVYLQVAPEAAQAFLPAGWTVTPLAAGAARDANLVLVFIDRKLALTPDGAPLQSGTNRLLVVLAPSRKTDSGEAALMVVGGYSADPAGAPGAYGVYTAGAVDVDRVERSEGQLLGDVEETWTARGADGSGVELRLAFTRAVPELSAFDLRVFSAANPGFYRIYRGDQVVDVLKSVHTSVDRVRRIELKAVGGGKLGAAIDGTETLIAVTSMPFYRRLTYLP